MGMLIGMAIEVVENLIDDIREFREVTQEEVDKADELIEIIKELGKYRAIGTPDECRAAVETTKTLKESYPWITFTCDNCGAVFVKAKTIYCPECNKKVLWEGEND